MIMLRGGGRAARDQSGDLRGVGGRLAHGGQEHRCLDLLHPGLSHGGGHRPAAGDWPRKQLKVAQDGPAGLVVLTLVECGDLVKATAFKAGQG
jgi:hypothetical protein